MNEYKPDVWVAIKIKRSKPALYKILAGWSGGYLDGQSWRINSGIERITEDEDYFYFHGSTGSIYKCSKAMERFNYITASVFASLKERVTLIPSKKLLRAFK